MRHELICLGKIKEKFIGDGIAEYQGRLRHYAGFSITVLKDRGKSANPAQVLEAESRALLQAVPDGAYLVVLDPGGKQLSSESLAQRISEWEMQGVKQVVYLVGGPDGHAPAVKARADLLLSLSLMTFTHDMARLLLVEQLYRAYTINAGERYHK